MKNNMEHQNNSNSLEGITRSKRFKRLLKSFIDSLIIAFVIAMAIKAAFLCSYKVPSRSMLDTVLSGDFVLSNRLIYILSEPKFGEVAVFAYPLNPSINLVKRVIGVPGDEIEIIENIVYRNGEMLEENYARYVGMPSIKNMHKITVPPGEYFVMGDNRDIAVDSRIWGFVPKEAFKSRAFMVYLSRDQDGRMRWERFFKLIK